MEISDELISLQEFANRFGVQTSVVRLWIREGRIPYTLVGPRMIKMIRPSDVVKPIEAANGKRAGDEAQRSVPSGAAGRDSEGARLSSEDSEIEGRDGGAVRDPTTPS